MGVSACCLPQLPPGPHPSPCLSSLHYSQNDRTSTPAPALRETPAWLILACMCVSVCVNVCECVCISGKGDLSVPPLEVAPRIAPLTCSLGDAMKTSLLPWCLQRWGALFPFSGSRRIPAASPEVCAAHCRTAPQYFFCTSAFPLPYVRFPLWSLQLKKASSWPQVPPVVRKDKRRCHQQNLGPAWHNLYH